jgi:hypothetical protein
VQRAVDGIAASREILQVIVTAMHTPTHPRSSLITNSAYKKSALAFTTTKAVDEDGVLLESFLPSTSDFIESNVVTRKIIQNIPPAT